MSVPSVVVAYVLMAVVALTAAGNWSLLVGWYRRGRTGSMILLVSAVLGPLACALHPDLDWRWGFLAAAVDPGCFGFLWAVPLLFRRRRD